MPIVAAAVIGGTALFASAKVQSNASKSAANTAAASADKGIEFQKEKFEQAQRANSPYMNLGANAVNNLGYGLGVKGYESGSYQGPQAPGLETANGGAPPGQATAAGGAPPGQLVTLRAPNGQMKQVPSEQAAHFMQQGATVVPTTLASSLGSLGAGALRQLQQA